MLTCLWWLVLHLRKPGCCRDDIFVVRCSNTNSLLLHSARSSNNPLDGYFSPVPVAAMPSMNCLRRKKKRTMMGRVASVEPAITRS